MAPDSAPWVVPIRSREQRARIARLWWVYLLCGAVGVALHGQLSPGAVHDATYLLVAVSGVAAMVVGLRVHQPRHASAWWLVLAGLLCWLVGNALRFTGLADVATWGAWAFIVGYPVIAVGLHRLAVARAPRDDRAGHFDATTVVVAVGLVAFVFLIQPSLADATSPLVAFAQVASPVGDVILLGGFVRIVTTPGSWVTGTRLLTFALGLKLLGDFSLYGFQVYAGGPPAWLDYFWLMAWVCWGAAGLHPSMTRVTEPAGPDGATFGAGRLALCGVAMAVPTAVVVVEYVSGDTIEVWPVVLGSAVLIGLVLARIQLAMRQIAEISEQAVELQDQLAFEATHDSLTLLPNRAHGMKLLEDALVRARRTRATTTVMFLDLDGFKQVNDTLGHRAGDQLLRRIGERLQRAVRGEDQAIRLGGDEFVVVLQALPDAETAMQVAARLIETVSQPVHLGPQGTARVGASVGIAQAHAGRTEAATLLNEADLAAYRAKRAGKGRAEVFDGDMRAGVSSQERLAGELRVAIHRDELVLHYQPVVDSTTGEVRGYEALVRWQHPRLGLLQPGDFLAAAEGSDLICDVDRWVLRRATAQLQDWVTTRKFDGLVMAVNLSPTTAARSRVVDDVAEALRLSGLRPDRLVLELPERVLEDRTHTVQHLHRVRALGVSVSITDFGAGVAALAQLATLPVNVVKIGRQALDVDTPLGNRLLQLMIQSAHAVGLNAVAEGVERDDQLTTLRLLDCEMVQGYHIAHPMAADQVPAFHLDRYQNRFSGLLR